MNIIGSYMQNVHMNILIRFRCMTPPQHSAHVTLE